MYREKKNAIRLILLVFIFLLLMSSKTMAAVTGFVAKGSDGNLYQYKYEELLDSYALKILGLSNGLYEDFSAKDNYALLNSSGIYIDYNALMERYVSALLLQEKFDLKQYLQSSEAKKASMPESLILVTLKSGTIENTTIQITSIAVQPNPAHKPAKTQTLIIGSTLLTVENAQQWALKRKADQSFVDIAPTYWVYGEKTGIRPEVLYAQAALETNFGQFSDQLPRSYHNWAGIKLSAAGADNDSAHYEKFLTPTDGVRAHFNEMAAFIGLKAVGEPHQRYHEVSEQFWAGSILHVEDLSGKWTDQPGYHEEILQLLNELAGDIEPDQHQADRDSVPEKETIPEEKDREHVAVDVNLLRLRSGPGTDFAILDLLPMGTVLEVTGRDADWLQVITPQGKQGWIYGDYVKTVDMSVSPIKGKTVVIDPGHGGSDPGAIGVTGLREKVLNLAIARLFAEMLEEAGANVVMTRKGDYAVSNSIRVKVANDSGGDVYISIHANSFSSSESNGTETYFSPQKKSNADSFLAQQLQREMVSALNLRNRGVKENNFFVLKNVKMPAALIEVAFLSNPREEELLKKEEAQRKAAQALFNGLQAFFLQYR